MLYYDSKGNLVEFKESNAYSEGTNAVIYKKDSLAVKKYFCNGDTIITQEMFDFLKSIDNPNFIKLIERYYALSKIKNYNKFIASLANPKTNNELYNRDTYKIDLYTYYWIEKEYIDILEESKDYLLENFISLLKISDCLSDNRVGLADIKSENTICNQNSIVLIDPDMYYFISEYSHTDLHKKNRLRIICLMSSLCRSLTRHISYETSDKVTELFKESLDNPQSAEKILTKNLRGYKKPIDYIKNN